MTKKRNINEYRQVRDSVYTHPDKEKGYYRGVKFDSMYVVELIKNFPNDQELGKEIREYFNSIKND
jgi:hypothetical protein